MQSLASRSVSATGVLANTATFLVGLAVGLRPGLALLMLNDVHDRDDEGGELVVLRAGLFFLLLQIVYSRLTPSTFHHFTDCGFSVS